MQPHNVFDPFYWWRQQRWQSKFYSSFYQSQIYSSTALALVIETRLDETIPISSSFGLLWVESHHFSQAEEDRTVSFAVLIHKMTTIFTQKDNLGPFCEFAQPCKQFFIFCLFLNLRKIAWINSQQPKTRGHLENLYASKLLQNASIQLPS